MKNNPGCRLLARAGLYLYLIFSLSPALNAQSPARILVLPVHSTQFTEEERFAASEYLAGFITGRYDYGRPDMDSLRVYFTENSLPENPGKEDLQRVFKDLDVGLILIPYIDEKEGGRQFRVSLFDASQNAIVKTVTQPCVCMPGDKFSFPLRRIAELLFSAPDIILDAGDDEAAPAPLHITLPNMPAQPDTSAAPGADTPEIENPPIIRTRRPWGRYATGALIVSAGVLYLTTRPSGGDNENTPLKLPPALPDGNR